MIKLFSSGIALIALLTILPSMQRNQELRYFVC